MGRRPPLRTFAASGALQAVFLCVGCRPSTLFCRHPHLFVFGAGRGPAGCLGGYGGGDLRPCLLCMRRVFSCPSDLAHVPSSILSSSFLSFSFFCSSLPEYGCNSENSNS